MQTHSGASLAWNVCGPMILPMLNDAEMMERPDTCCSISIIVKKTVAWGKL